MDGSYYIYRMMLFGLLSSRMVRTKNQIEGLLVAGPFRVVKSDDASPVWRERSGEQRYSSHLPSGLTFLRIDDRRVIGITGGALLVAKRHLSPILQFVCFSIKEGHRQMPRTARAQFGARFEQLRKLARQLLVSLRSEIRSGEAELGLLKEAEASLSRLTGLRESAVGRTEGRAARAVTRTNWNTVLEQLPQQFKASDLRTVPGVEGKRSSQLFAAITHWIEAGLVRRKGRGLYERVQPGRPRKPKKGA